LGFSFLMFILGAPALRAVGVLRTRCSLGAFGTASLRSAHSACLAQDGGRHY
jgi:hypothetical protein